MRSATGLEELAPLLCETGSPEGCLRTEGVLLYTAAGSALGIFDSELAAHQKLADLLIHWYSTIDTHGLDGLRNEINHG